MGDGVSPQIQVLQMILAIGIASIQFTDFVPKRDPKYSKIRTEIAGIGIPSIQGPVK